MKKGLMFLLTAVSLVGLSGCGCAPQKSLVDTDFDGLYDYEDPDKNNNVYKFHMEQVIDEERKNITVQDQVAVDYRYIINHTPGALNKELALGSIALISSNYVKGDGEIMLENNVFRGGDQKADKFYRQFGLVDFEDFKMEKSAYAVDVWDRTDARLGHHITELDNKKYNVFVVTVQPYLDRTGWSSNFDYGYDGPEYYNIFGNDHPEWIDKQEHKGYAVASRRLEKKIKEYVTAHTITGADNKIFITGHSRGGAITGLVTKHLTDEGHDILGYAFNPSTSTTEADPEIRNKYKNLINIINEDDIVPSIPLYEWGGFTHYGISYSYKVSKDASSLNAYKNYQLEDSPVKEYAYPSAKFLEEFYNILTTWIDSRKACFVDRPDDPSGINGYEYYETEEEANERKDALLDKFPADDVAKKTYSVTVENGTWEGHDEHYRVKIVTKPAILITLVQKLFDIINTQPEDMMDQLLDLIFDYFPFIKRYVNESSTALSYLDGIDCIKIPHIVKTNLVGIRLIGD